GVRLINLYDNDKVSDITLIPHDLDDEELDVEVGKLKKAAPPKSPADDEDEEDINEIDIDEEETDEDIE
ncbi:MAG: hypothetical protein QM218_05050, partial [Candidatus Cloacimonadota bacterium]|nr:hypothetical protein [Candidatus Cloacimonadota bacterium]